MKEWQIIQTIKKNQYDLILNLTEGDRGALVAKFAKAKVCVGPDPHGKGFTGKRKAYTHLVRHCGSPRHNVERNLDALRRIGIFPTDKEKRLSFHIPPNDQQMIQKTIQNQFKEEGYILIHPAARWKFKCWPAFRLKNLIKMLIERGQNVVITSSNDPVEMQYIKEVIEERKADKHLLDLSGKVSIKQLGSLVKGCLMLFCMDSLPVHLSSVFQTKVVTLFGPTSELQWGPWQNPNATVLTTDISCRPCSIDGCGGSKMSDCLYQISEKDVLDALLQPKVMA